MSQSTENTAVPLPSEFGHDDAQTQMVEDLKALLSGPADVAGKKLVEDLFGRYTCVMTLPWFRRLYTALCSQLATLQKARVVPVYILTDLRDALEGARSAARKVDRQCCALPATTLNAAYRTVGEPLPAAMVEFALARKTFRMRIEAAQRTCSFVDQEKRDAQRVKAEQKRERAADSARRHFTPGSLWASGDEVFRVVKTSQKHVHFAVVSATVRRHVAEKWDANRWYRDLVIVGKRVNVTNPVPAPDAEKVSFYLGESRTYKIKSGQRACTGSFAQNRGTGGTRVVKVKPGVQELEY